LQRALKTDSFSPKNIELGNATATFWWWWTQVIEYIWTGHKRLCWQRNYHYKWKSFELVQQNTVLYDKSGEQHYDIVSAFIKSIRGSDPNGAVYWLAEWLKEKTWNLDACLFYRVRTLKRKPYCLYNGQQYVSGGYHHISWKPNYIKPMCHLSPLLKKQCHSTAISETNRWLTDSYPFTQCAY
jgi:hypothetical protein